MEEKLINVGEKPYVILQCSCGQRHVYKYNVYKLQKEINCHRCGKRLK